MATVFSHHGICVADLDRSLRFYTEALGFTKAEDFTVGSEFAALMGLDDVQLTSQFLEKDGVRLELLFFGTPEAIGEATMRPINKLWGSRTCRSAWTTWRRWRPGWWSTAAPCTNPPVPPWARSTSSTAPTPTAPESSS